MIRDFRNAATQAVFEGEIPRGVPRNLCKVARRKLAMIHAARELRDLASPPGNRLHPLHDDREGQFAIWINDQFRICFRWQNGDAYEVEIVDYH